MQFERTLRRTAELGIGLTAIATLILAGCGGGGSSSSSGGSSVATTTTTVTPYKGMFTSGTVTLVDANGNAVTLSAGGTINASGVASITYPANVAYPLTVNVTGTYLNETAGGASAVIAAGSPLQGLIPSTSEAASGVPVTAVTHVARTMLPASGFSAASAVAAITGAASSVLGISSYSQAMLPPVFNAQGQTTDPATIKLAALANVIGQQGAGADLGAKLHDIANKLAAGSAVTAVIPQASFDAALAAVNQIGGASGVVPVGATAPTIPPITLPGTGLNAQIAASIPSCAAGQVLQYTASGLTCVSGGTVAPSLTCNTNLFAGGVRDATAGELAAYAQTYSGNTGSFDQNMVFTSSGNATLVFGASGALTYNTQAQTVTSICYETAVPQLVVHFGSMGHVDLNTNGDFTGFDGTNVIRKVTAGGGAAPAISGVNPSTGAVGTAVYINGSNLNGFTPEPLVKFGTTTAAVTSFSYLGGVQITVNVPAGLAAGNYAITVSNGDGSGLVNAGTFNVTASGSGTYTPPANLGTLAATGAGAAQFGSSFAPSTLTSVDYFGLSWQYKWSISSTQYVLLDGSTVTIINANPTWQKPLAPLAQLSYDATAGTITFTDLTTTTAVGGATSPLVLNGTLYIAPLNSGPVSLSGTGTSYTGTGFDAPAAAFASTATVETWTWTDIRGTKLKLTHVLTNGNYQLQITGLGGTPFLSSIASLATLGIAIDSNAKTVTLSNTAATNNNTGTSVTLGGTLSIP